MKAVIISGGNWPSKELVEKEIKDCKFIICADSGGNSLCNYGIVPDYIIGDFDSIDKKCLDYFKQKECCIEKYPREKDFTDTELAIEKCFQLKCDEIVLLGCTGNRLDHVLANIGLLFKILKSNKKACIKDNNNTIILIDKPTKISPCNGKNFSLQAFGGQVKNLTIKDAKYELNNYDLQMGDPRTISNEFLDKKVQITFEKGILLIMFCND